MRASGAHLVYINGLGSQNIGRLLGDLRAAVGPDVALIGYWFIDVRGLFAIGGGAMRGVLGTTLGLTPDALGPSGRRFVRAFAATQPHGRVTTWDVHAAAATEVLLDAIARSNGTRKSVAGALQNTRLADSIVGPLVLDRNGEPLTTRSPSLACITMAGDRMSCSASTAPKSSR